MFHAMGGMGAGDVKLMAAIGAWLGMPMTFYVFIATALAAGVYAVVLLVVSGPPAGHRHPHPDPLVPHQAFGRHLGADDRVEAEVKRDDRRRRLIPFAAMVAVGVIAPSSGLEWADALRRPLEAHPESPPGGAPNPPWLLQLRHPGSCPVRPQSLVVVVLALIFGGSAAVGISSFLNSRARRPQVDTVPVVVAAVDLPRGGTITPT